MLHTYFMHSYFIYIYIYLQLVLLTKIIKMIFIERQIIMTIIMNFKELRDFIDVSKNNNLFSIHFLFRSLFEKSENSYF